MRTSVYVCLYMQSGVQHTDEYGSFRSQYHLSSQLACLLGLCVCRSQLLLPFGLCGPHRTVVEIPLHSPFLHLMLTLNNLPAHPQNFRGTSSLTSGERERAKKRFKTSPSADADGWHVLERWPDVILLWDSLRKPLAHIYEMGLGLGSNAKTRYYAVSHSK